MEKKQKLQRIWLVLSGMAFWGLMMPATILGILISIGVIYILISVAADRKSTRLNSSHSGQSRMPSSA